ncbi:MAG: hypothetical protein ABI852_16530 [Gemmatimonadaceae bacterium]
MKDYAQQAAFHRAALLLGLTNGKEVLAWADHVIMQDADAPHGFVELSLVPADDLSELRHALQPMAALIESPLILPALFDRVRDDFHTGSRTAKDSLTVLSQVRGFMKVPAQLSEEIATLVNAHMLATAHVTGDISETETRVREWLNQFAGGESAFHKEFS